MFQSSFGFRQQAIKEKVPRVLPRNALHSLTARRHQRSTTRECSCADQSSHYNIGVWLTFLPSIAVTTLHCSTWNFWDLVLTHALEDMPSAPLSPVMPSEPNVLPASAALGSAASITSAVPGPTPTVAQSTPRDSVGPLLALLITFDNRSLLKSEMYNIAFANPYKITVI